MAQPLQKIIANRYGGAIFRDAVLPTRRVALSSNPEMELLARSWRGLKAWRAGHGRARPRLRRNDIDSRQRARAIAVAGCDGRRNCPRPR